MPEPKLSVVVITYNSQATVVETLQSLLLQDCSVLELIISDDASSDSTVDICENWLHVNAQKFNRTQLIRAPQNAGIPANCNAGISEATGEWVKLIAGDDFFSPRALNQFLSTSRESEVIATWFTKFKDIDSKRVIIERLPKDDNLPFFSRAATAQFEWLSLHDFNLAPGVFIKRSVFHLHGLFAERYPLIEDLPYWLKLTRNGVRFEFLEINTVMYRAGEHNISLAGGRIHNVPFMRIYLKAKAENILPFTSLWNWTVRQEILLERLKFRLQIGLFKNKHSALEKRVMYVIDLLKLTTIKRFAGKLGGK